MNPTQIWDRYWHQGDYAASRAFVRVGVAAASLLTWVRTTQLDYGTFLSQWSAAPYQPKGLLALLGNTVPPPELFVVSKYVWLIAAVATLLGVASRLSMTVSLVAGLLCVGVLYSFSAGWSQGYCVVFLAQIPALFITEKRGSSSPWALILTSWAVALMFFSAGVQKLRSGGWSLDWAFSDSLRAHLIRRYPMSGEALPSYLEFLADHRWAWQGVAMGNFISQLCPVVACIFFRSPRLRLLFGSFFLLELLGLGVVMGLWDWHLLPLAVVFVDWDNVLPRVRFRVRAPTAVICAYLGIWLVLIASPDHSLRHRWNIFPFSNFDMYSTVYAAGDFSYTATEYEFDAPSIAPATRADSERGFQRENFGFAGSAPSSEAIRSHLEYLSRSLAGWSARRIAVYAAEYVVPAHPAPARPVLVRRTLLGSVKPPGNDPNPG